MKIGLVCPYSFDIPGGVQAHVADLAETLIGLGHRSGARTRATRRRPNCRSSSFRPGARSPIPYNGSVARLSFGPTAYSQGPAVDQGRQIRRAAHARAGRAEPVDARVEVADGPIVATFHTATASRGCSPPSRACCSPFLEKITGRIAVSELARRWQVEALGWDAVIIPNGVHVGASRPRRCSRLPARRGTSGFVGRYDESRKGMAVLLDALRLIVEHRPTCRCWSPAAETRNGCAPAGRAGGPPPVPRPGQRRGQGVDAQVDIYCDRTPAGRVSGSSSSRRWPPAPPWSPATSTRSAGCCETGPPGCWSRSATRYASPGRSTVSSPTTVVERH